MLVLDKQFIREHMKYWVMCGFIYLHILFIIIITHCDHI